MNYWEENSNEKWTRNYEINKSTLREKQIQRATTKEKPTLNKKKMKNQLRRQRKQEIKEKLMNLQ